MFNALETKTVGAVEMLHVPQALVYANIWCKHTHSMHLQSLFTEILLLFLSKLSA